MDSLVSGAMTGRSFNIVSDLAAMGMDINSMSGMACSSSLDAIAMSEKSEALYVKELEKLARSA